MASGSQLLPVTAGPTWPFFFYRSVGPPAETWIAATIGPIGEIGVLSELRLLGLVAVGARGFTRTGASLALFGVVGTGAN